MPVHGRLASYLALGPLITQRRVYARETRTRRLGQPSAESLETVA